MQQDLGIENNMLVIFMGLSFWWQFNFHFAFQHDKKNKQMHFTW
jgi:hypothetical protein